MLLLGSLGAGTLMLATRLNTILPAMTPTEALETTCNQRVAGLAATAPPSPRRAHVAPPTDIISDVGLVGEGPVPRLSGVSLADHGVLFLDARPECRRQALEVLRQPLEEDVVTSARISMRRLPALKPVLWRSGLPVAWIVETGRRRARLALSLGLRLGAFIKGVFKDLFPGERVDGGRLVHLICRLGQDHPQIPGPACADVFLGQARIVLTQLGDLSALLAEPRHEGSVMRQEDQIATRPVAVCRGGSQGTRSRGGDGPARAA